MRVKRLLRIVVKESSRWRGVRRAGRMGRGIFSAPLEPVLRRIGWTRGAASWPC